LRDYASDRAKIGQRAVDLSREEGAFITSTIGDLSAALTRRRRLTLTL
jgi:hypothetical protein